MKSLSKSVGIMFTADLAILVLSTLFWCGQFGFSCKLTITTEILLVVTGLIVLFLKGYYKIREFNVTSWNAYRLFEGVIFAHIPAAILLFFFLNKVIFVKFFCFNILTVLTGLALYRICFHYYLFNFKKVKKVLIIGANDRAKAIAEVIKNKQALQMEVVGIVKLAQIEKHLSEELSKQLHYELTKSDIEELDERIEDEKNFNYTEVPIYDDLQIPRPLREQRHPEQSEGSPDAASEGNLINKTETDIVIFTYKSHLVSVIPQNIKIYYMPDFYEMSTGKFYVDEDTVQEFAYDVHKKYSHSSYDFLKRILDVISAAIILTVTLPVTGYIALRVWFTDKHSPFFTQTRVGKNGKRFECYKLRTMYVNDYVPKNAQMLNNGADRTIPWCGWVRKAKLDEIPQMINILKGEMSIVGPRAEWEDFANVFEQDVPYYKLRNIIPAGWTGWAHINMQAAYSVDEEKERLSYDLYYIKHRNILWDLAILVKAVFLACGGRHK